VAGSRPAVGRAQTAVPTVQRLLDTAVDIMGEPNPSACDRAFMARQLVQATLPHSDPGNVPVWTRTNGRLTLVVRPHYDRQKQQHLHPYGTVPRLLLFWITTEAVHTRSRILHPGATLAAFMHDLGMNPDNGSSGAKRSDARRLRDQMTRLFRATISFEVNDGNAQAGSAEWIDMQIATGGKVWWDFRQPAQGTLFESVIELGERFYEALVAAPVPVDLRALNALKRSPLALDLYAWATYRTYTVAQAGKPAIVTWASLAAQMGGDYGRLDNFVCSAKAALQKVQAVYPTLRIGDAEGGFVLKPSASAVRPRTR
jgi:Plasmid encoded RepA protein